MSNTETTDILDNIPGGEIVNAGLADLSAKRETVEALLVLVAAPRLRGLNIPVPEVTFDASLPHEHQLYQLLEEKIGVDRAYSRYNSLVRRIVSFSRALASCTQC